MRTIVEIKIIELDPKLDFNFSYFQYISCQRRIKVFNFRNIEDRKRCLISELLIRSAAYDKLNTPLNEIEISYNPYGKPYLNNVRHFKFNISHSGKYVAIAVSRQKVGIDIENLKDIDMQVSKRFFTANEHGYIESFATNQEKIDAFYTIWTLKESYIKAVGKGLRIPLNSFEIILQNEISLKNNERNKFRFSSKKINDYILSVCYQEKKLSCEFQYVNEQEFYESIKRSYVWPNK